MIRFISGYSLVNSKLYPTFVIMGPHLDNSINRILIIDDELEVCMLLEKYLEKKNKKASYSTSLQDGIAKFKAKIPDLLILDHNLPDGFGIDHINLFKSLNPDLKIVIISAMSNLKDEALQKGADHFLEKPISFGTLNSILAGEKTN
jgi:DNA-binding response OmpR family regulator